MGEIRAINITGPVCSTSYGLVVQNIVKACIQRGLEVSLRPIGPIDPDVGCGYEKFIEQCEPNFFKGCPHLIIWHQFDLKKFLQPNSRNIGFPIFELDNFDDREIDSINSCDALVTCSQWGVDILNRFTKKPTGVVPLGVDRDVIFPLQQTFYKDDLLDSKVEFCQLSKWEIRKGQAHVMKAFSEVFSDIDDVQLTMVCHNDFIGDENLKWANLGKKLCGDKLKIHEGRFESHRDVNTFLNTQDVGVFPSLAEGFNLSLLEMLSLGKQCIATNYSGHTQFCGDFKNTCHLIEIDELEPAFDSRWFFCQGNWARFAERQQQQ